MAVNRIHHTGVVVRSIDDAFARFRDVLGLPVVREAVIEEQGVRAVLLDLGNSYLELLEPVVPDTGIARFLERRGEGLHHVCLEVDDIRATLADLKARGVQLIDDEPQQAVREGLVGTVAFLHPSSFHGVLVELVEAGSGPGDPTPPGAGAGVGITRLHHLVLAVEQLAPAADTWSRAFDLHPSDPARPADTHLELAQLPFDNDDAFLELVADTEWGEPALGEAAERGSLPPGRRVARFLHERGSGMLSISLEVDDLDAAVAHLRANGLDVSDPEPGILPDTRIVRIPRAAAHGVAVQLLQRR